MNLTSGILIDVQNYKVANSQLGTDHASQTKVWDDLRIRHVQDVKRFQKAMQMSDVVFWESETRRGLRNNGDWLSAAVGAAVKHRANLKTIIGCKDDEILQVNVFSLYALGTTKKYVLEKIKSVLPLLNGSPIVFYPVLPRGARRTTLEVVAGAAVDYVDMTAPAAPVDDSDSDVDDAVHDFNSDGLLPEAITSVHSVRSQGQKNAFLAKDCCLVDSVVGMADVETRYPKKLLWLHANDGSGEKISTAGFVLLPVEDKFVALQESLMLKTGAYIEVPAGMEYMAVSKKLSLQARRTLQEHWKFEARIERAQRFAVCKSARAQFGTGFHKTWLEDIAKTCGVPVVLVCDYAHGCGEIQRALLDVKTGMAAVGANVRMCSWAHDPRKVFADVGGSVRKSLLGELYLSRKLTLPGHHPIDETARTSPEGCSQLCCRHHLRI